MNRIDGREPDELRPVVEKAAEVMNFRDIIAKEDFSAGISRVVFAVYFEPDAPAVASIKVKRNPGPLLRLLFCQQLAITAIFGVQAEEVRPG